MSPLYRACRGEFNENLTLARILPKNAMFLVLLKPDLPPALFNFLGCRDK